jgi:hypothetical protein
MHNVLVVIERIFVSENPLKVYDNVLFITTDEVDAFPYLVSKRCKTQKTMWRGMIPLCITSNMLLLSTDYERRHYDPFNPEHTLLKIGQYLIEKPFKPKLFYALDHETQFVLGVLKRCRLRFQKFCLLKKKCKENLLLKIFIDLRIQHLKKMVASYLK